MSIMEYLNKMKNITDQLAMVGYEVSDNDMVQRALNRIDPEYHVLSTTMLYSDFLPIFEN